MTGTTDTGGTSRRGFLRGAAAVSLAGGTLTLVDALAGGITRAEAARTTAAAHDEQYLVDGLEAITDNGVTVVIPPLYKYILTARLRQDRTWNAKTLQAAQTQLENALRNVEQGRPRTAAGLTVVVAWGLPYFRRFITPTPSASTWSGIWPLDTSGGTTKEAVLDAVSFPSDPSGLLLESNEVMFMFRSDSLATLDDVKGTLFSSSGSGYIGGLFEVTSVRTGFVGRGFGDPSTAKKLAVAAGVPNAEKIPDRSQLMMGFTSTQQAALGPGNIVSFETLGLTNVRPGDYFAGGCAMHLSHIYEDLRLWYGMGYSERTRRMFSASASAADGTVTIPNGPGDVTSLKQLQQDAKKGVVGHNETLQQATRLAADVTDAYGVRHPAGTPVPIREDFNTLDTPFTTTAEPSRDGWSSVQNSPGLHFVALVPTSGRFHLARQAMDGILPDGTNLKIATKDNGINSMLRTTHRQNFLVPPRGHRSFPMAELLG